MKEGRSQEDAEGTEGGDVNRKTFPEHVLALLENILGKVP